MIENIPVWLEPKYAVYYLVATMALSIVLRITGQIDKPWAKQVNAICVDILGVFKTPKPSDAASKEPPSGIGGALALLFFMSSGAILVGSIYSCTAAQQQVAAKAVVGLAECSQEVAALTRSSTDDERAYYGVLLTTCLATRATKLAQVCPAPGGAGILATAALPPSDAGIPKDATTDLVSRDR